MLGKFHFLLCGGNPVFRNITPLPLPAPPPPPPHPILPHDPSLFCVMLKRDTTLSPFRDLKGLYQPLPLSTTDQISTFLGCFSCPFFVGVLHTASHYTLILNIECEEKPFLRFPQLTLWLFYVSCKISCQNITFFEK